MIAVDVAHVHECPTAPNKGARVTTPDTVQTWLPGNPVIPGEVWCWSHRAWELDSSTKIPVHTLTAGDVFARHGHTWTAEHVVRSWGSSVHVICVGGGDVWFPQGATVVVTGHVDLAA